MRHVLTLIAAIIIAPVAWILLAFGQQRSGEEFADAQRAGVFDGAEFLRPVQVLAAAGLLLGLVALLRFSPLGALLTGLSYVASYTLLLIVPNGWVDLLGRDLTVAGRHIDPTTPIRSGTGLLLGMVLLAGAVTNGRRRHRPQPADEAFPTPAEDRPLGADGLGLLPSGRSAEPEVRVRYPSRPRPALTGDAHRGPATWRHDDYDSRPLRTG